jgi:RNA polymerase sigma factor (sigma-70 family)
MLLSSRCPGALVGVLDKNVPSSDPDPASEVSMADHATDMDALLARACSGDDAALEQAMVLTTPLLRTHIEHEIQARWKGYLTIEDILQETYLDAYASFSRFTPDGENAFLRWLKRIALNNITDAVRAISQPGAEDHQRTPRHLTGFGPHLTLLKTVVGMRQSLNVSHAATEEEARGILSRIMAGLLEHERFVVGQLFFQERTAAEVAAELGRTIGAVHLIRNRALRKLREMFDDGAGNSGATA